MLYDTLRRGQDDQKHSMKRNSRLAQRPKTLTTTLRKVFAATEGNGQLTFCGHEGCVKGGVVADLSGKPAKVRERLMIGVARSVSNED